MTQWAHITRTDWAQTIGQDAAAELFSDFLGRGGDVQLVLPDRRTGEGDDEATRELHQLVRFVKTDRQSKFLVHPEPSQMQETTDRGVYQDTKRVVVILWNAERTFEGWLSAQGSHPFCPSEAPAPVDPAVTQALK